MSEKFLSLFLMLTIVMSVVCSGIPASAEEIEKSYEQSAAINEFSESNESEVLKSGDFEYIINKKGKVQITAYTGRATHIDFPNTIDGKSVTEIREIQFTQNDTVTSVFIPENITYVSWGFFSEFSALKNIEVDSNNSKYISENGILFTKDKLVIECYPQAKDGTSYRIPDGVTEINDYAFSNCKKLKSLYISKDIITVSGSSMYFSLFNGCTSLEDFIVSDDNQYLCSIDGIIYSKDKTALKCFPAAKKGEVIIPNGVEVIFFQAFNKCDKITKVFIPESVEYIGLSTTSPGFCTCSNLKEIIISEQNKNFCSVDGVVYSKDMTTYYDYSGGRENNYIMPDTVTEMWGDFRYCTTLKSITLSKNLKYVTNFGFMGCTNLESVIVPGLFDSSINFAGCDKVTIYGNKGSSSESFAKENNIPFKLISQLPKDNTQKGDIDGDNIVTSADALLILRYSVKLETFNSAQINSADIDGDQIITSADSLAALRISVGLPV